MKDDISTEKKPESGAAKTELNKFSIAGYIALGIGIVLVAALVFILLTNRAKSVVMAPMQSHQPGNALTQVPPPQAPPANALTQAPAPTAAPNSQPVQAPQDVLDFLRDVGIIEQHRKQLLNDKGPAVALLAGGGDALEALIRQAMDPYSNENFDPFLKVRTELSRQLKHWQDVLRSFDTLQPPASCKQFAGSYRWVLAAEAQQIGKAATILNDVKADQRDSMSQALSALSNMKSDPNTQGSIDQAVNTSDAQLDALCKQFGMAKPFSIYKESSGGSLLLP